MRHSDPFDKRSWMGSLAVHAVALGVGIYAVAPAHPVNQFVTYQIELVSPPPTRQAKVATAAKDKLVVERPKPTPQEDKPAPVVKPEVKRRSSKAAPPKPKPTESTETAKKKETAASPDAEVSKKKGGEGINVRLEGLKRDYPAYYANIIRQIERCFRPPHNAGQLVTTVYFVIHKDGSVADLDIVKKSGDPSFDFLAMGAVECAGKGRFGALPKDVPFDRLPIAFTFSPSNSGVGGGS